MSKHFCCCIPVRFGVFVFSLFQFAAEGFLSFGLWYAFHLMVTNKTFNGVDYGSYSHGDRIGVAVVAAVYTVLALVALFGFIGSIIRNRRMVKLYSVTVWITFFCVLASSIFWLYLVYSGRKAFQGCEVNGKDCSIQVHYNLWQKIVITVGTVFHLLIQVYIASVIGKYVDQLESERDDWSREYKLAKPTNASTYEPSYYPPQAQDAQQGLLNPSGGAYPYTDQAHHFGNKDVQV